MNLGTLADLAVAKAFSPAEDERGLAVNRPLVIAWINAAYHRVERAAMWKFSEARATLQFSPGSPSPTNLPNDIALALHLTHADNGEELMFHDVRQQAAPPLGESRHPSAYSLWGGILSVHPTPSAEVVLDLRYYRLWPELVAESDEPLFPALWHEILSDYAAARLLLRMAPSGGRQLRESEARPFESAWQMGLAEMLASPHVLVSGDIINNHQILDSVDLGAGVDW